MPVKLDEPTLNECVAELFKLSMKLPMSLFAQRQKIRQNVIQLVTIDMVHYMVFRQIRKSHAMCRNVLFTIKQ